MSRLSLEEEEQPPWALLPKAGGGALAPTWGPQPRRLMTPALPSLTHKTRHPATLLRLLPRKDPGLKALLASHPRPPRSALGTTEEPQALPTKGKGCLSSSYSAAATQTNKTTPQGQEGRHLRTQTPRYPGLR